MENNLDVALDAWCQVLSEDYVRTDTQTIDSYSKSCSAYSTRPLAVLSPASSGDVKAIIDIARGQTIPLYPIGCGKNWGYGDACAVYEGQVIVDLARMNRIEEVNTSLGYAVIEPGVTQQQLSDYLREHNIPLWMDCTGSTPFSSLIGNVLERGFGHSPYGNRILTISCMEVVLGNGQIINTGFGHYPEAKAKNLYPYGVGPYLDGVFTQSNFGIVTKMTLWAYA